MDTDALRAANDAVDLPEPVETHATRRPHANLLN